MEYLKLLEAWGFDSANFIEQGITDESFRLLDSPTIEMLLPKAGPRLLFKRKLTEFLRRPSDICTTDIDQLNELFNTPEQTNDSINICSPISSPRSSLSVASSSPWTVPNLSLESEPEDLMLVKKSRTEASVGRKLPSIFRKDLESLLNSSTDGRLILLHRQKLNNDLRQKLCKIVVNELLTKNAGLSTEIKRNDFVDAAEEIVSCFPIEQKETYYVPYCSNKTGLRQPARGKLWSRYVNVKAALRIANQSLLVSDKKESQNQTLTETKELETEISFLKSAVEPYTRIVNSWEQTFQYRYKLYYNDKNTHDLFAIFPCLRCSFGLNLVELDFNHIYPERIDIVYIEWPKVSEAIIQECYERKIQLPQGVDRSTQALLILPYLFTPVTLKRNSKNPEKNWRPTRIEIQESFFLSVKTHEELQNIIEKREKILSKFDLPLQPFGVFIEKKEEFYIICGKLQFKTESSIRCFELLFKSFHGLNLNYPPECKHIWQFIQEMVFEIPVGSKCTSSASVIADINAHLLKQ